MRENFTASKLTELKLLCEGIMDASTVNKQKT